MMRKDSNAERLLATVHDSVVRIIRKKHRIGFRCDAHGCSTAADIKAKLDQIPTTATVDEVEIHELDDGMEICTIVFHEERPEP